MFVIVAKHFYLFDCLSSIFCISEPAHIKQSILSCKVIQIYTHRLDGMICFGSISFLRALGTRDHCRFAEEWQYLCMYWFYAFFFSCAIIKYLGKWKEVFRAKWDICLPALWRKRFTIFRFARWHWLHNIQHWQLHDSRLSVWHNNPYCWENWQSRLDGSFEGKRSLCYGGNGTSEWSISIVQCC